MGMGGHLFQHISLRAQAQNRACCPPSELLQGLATAGVWPPGGSRGPQPQSSSELASINSGMEDGVEVHPSGGTPMC